MSLLQMDAEVPEVVTGEHCPVCRRGRLVRTIVDFRFHQNTDRGRLTCRLALPVGTCSHCGFEMLDAEAEAKMEQAIRREYDKLSPLPNKKNE